MNKERRMVNVPVATVWTNAESSRDVDREAISSSADVEKWIGSLDYGQLLDLCEGNRVQTQVLFNEEVILLEEKDEWCSVLIPSQPSSKNPDGYPGWIPSCQLSALMENVAGLPVAMVRNQRAKVVFGDESEWTVSYGTCFRVAGTKNEKILVHTPKGLAQILKKDASLFPAFHEMVPGKGGDILSSAEVFVGLPYLWGGMSAFGYDCSGFTYNMCRANGYIIPRDAHDQAVKGDSIPLEEMEPGDLLFFAYEEGKGEIHHVAFYYGNEHIIHAPKTGKNVEIIPLKGMEYEKELCAVRRYTREAAK
ncbi:NlpC/P60 family protein [Bacillus sp. 1P06AnD]|uniref:C40 family peptidase n=1 Tax=Bacillus sp. 1P06AnD TaxID=3132208 RepID=UPI0039A14104